MRTTNYKEMKRCNTSNERIGAAASSCADGDASCGPPIRSNYFSDDNAKSVHVQWEAPATDRWHPGAGKTKCDSEPLVPRRLPPKFPCRQIGALLGMQSSGRPTRRRASEPGGAFSRLIWALLTCLCCWATLALGMTDDAVASLRYAR